MRKHDVFRLHRLRTTLGTPGVPLQLSFLPSFWYRICHLQAPIVEGQVTNDLSKKSKPKFTCQNSYCIRVQVE